jgi:hypothetical protein
VLREVAARAPSGRNPIQKARPVFSRTYAHFVRSYMWLWTVFPSLTPPLCRCSPSALPRLTFHPGSLQSTALSPGDGQRVGGKVFLGLQALALAYARGAPGDAGTR